MTEPNVCRPFLLMLFQISEKRLRIIQQKVLAGECFNEKRGTHAYRPHKIDDEVWDLAKRHLALIPSRESQYCRQKSKKRYLENSYLNTKKLYESLAQYYRDTTSRDLNLHYKTYHRGFLPKMNYGFIVARTGMCN